MKLDEIKVGGLITDGSSAGKVLELVDRDGDWKTRGVRVQNIALEQFGGNNGMSSFVAEYTLGSWRIVPMDWAPVTGGDLEERYVWAPDYSRLQRQVRRAEKTTIDWDRIGERLMQSIAEVNHEAEQRYGANFYAEALRRTLGFVPARGDFREHLSRGDGLQADAYAKHVYDNGALERMQLAKAQEQVKELRAEVRRVRAEAGKDLAEMLREICNERSVPSRYRREGVAWAADMIDPGVPKDQYGRLASDGAR